MSLLLLVAAVLFGLSYDGDGDGNGDGAEPNLRVFTWGRWVLKLWGMPGSWNYSGAIDGGVVVISGDSWPNALTAEIAAKQAAYDWEEQNEGGG